MTNVRFSRRLVRFSRRLLSLIFLSFSTHSLRFQCLGSANNLWYAFLQSGEYEKWAKKIDGLEIFESFNFFVLSISMLLFLRGPLFIHSLRRAVLFWVLCYLCYQRFPLELLFSCFSSSRIQCRPSSFLCFRWRLTELIFLSKLLFIQIHWNIVQPSWAMQLHFENGLIYRHRTGTHHLALRRIGINQRWWGEIAKQANDYDIIT